MRGEGGASSDARKQTNREWRARLEPSVCKRARKTIIGAHSEGGTQKMQHTIGIRAQSAVMGRVTEIKQKQDGLETYWQEPGTRGVNGDHRKGKRE